MGSTTRSDLGKGLDDKTLRPADSSIGAKGALDCNAYIPHTGDDMEEIWARLQQFNGSTQELRDTERAGNAYL